MGRALRETHHLSKLQLMGIAYAPPILGAVSVIPGRAKREPGIHNHDREYGFRACAKWRIPE
jgi:hypothetical protein